jgi:integrase
VQHIKKHTKTNFPLGSPLAPDDAVLLSPSGLSAAARFAVADLLAQGESVNTQVSYRSALRYWAAWHALRYGKQIELPVPVAAVMQFVVDHAQRTGGQGLVHELPLAIDQALVDGRQKGKLGALSYSTIVHRISVLSKAHQAGGHVKANPCVDPGVRELLSRTRKAHAKRGALPVKKDAITADPLLAMLSTCDDSLAGMRDRALLLFAWSSGGRRRSEVAAADIAFLRETGPDSYEYNLAFSKSNQSGQDRPENHKPVIGQAGQALRAWLAASKIVEGPIFRRVRKGGHVAEPLTPAAVKNIVKKRAAMAGLEGDFAGHSLRSGFVTEAGRQGVGLAETMAMTGHTSVSTLLGYYRSSDQSKAADLLG